MTTGLGREIGRELGLTLPPTWPYVNEATQELAHAARSWDRLQRWRVGLQISGMASPSVLEGLHALEKQEGRRAQRALKKHELWPFLEPLRGLRGPSVCLVIGMIRDPRRFPGQLCEKGHYLPAGLFPVGAPCPVLVTRNGKTAEGEEIEAERAYDTEDGPFSSANGNGDGGETTEEAIANDLAGGCGAPILEPRPYTGVRSLYHYFALDVVNGKARRKVRGEQATFNPRGKALFLAPDGGIAAQIVRHNCEPYVTVYREGKVRLLEREGIDVASGNVRNSGSPPQQAQRATKKQVAKGVESSYENESWNGPRSLLWCDKTARKIGVKRFAGDLLMNWKACL